jgi:hypothetical protein
VHAPTYQTAADLNGLSLLLDHRIYPHISIIDPDRIAP